MKDSPYFKQAQLMLRAMPHVTAVECFALKGGIDQYPEDEERETGGIATETSGGAGAVNERR